jgi:hypothetical protein
MTGVDKKYVKFDSPEVKKPAERTGKEIMITDKESLKKSRSSSILDRFKPKDNNDDQQGGTGR